MFDQEHKTKARERSRHNARAEKRRLENRPWEDHERASPNKRVIAGSSYLNKPKRTEAEARAQRPK